MDRRGCVVKVGFGGIDGGRVVWWASRGAALRPGFCWMCGLPGSWRAGRLMEW
jgi:hypothetical protein